MASRGFVSDFDFTVYVDAHVSDVRSWYVELPGAAQHGLSGSVLLLHRYASLSDAEAADTAGRIWAEINEPNLLKNILPTRERADLVLRKGADHAVEEVRLRKL
jgi:type I pantothenate kinase